MIVQAHGCFDILHYGHLLHLKFAKSLGDHLVVTITADQYITKGPGRPVFNDAQRAEMLRELRCVDEVQIIHAPDAVTALEAIKPDIYVKGREYEGQLPELDFCKTFGIRVVFSDEAVHSSIDPLSELKCKARGILTLGIW